MKIKSNLGYIATIRFLSDSTEVDFDYRERLFNATISHSNITPNHLKNGFDETICIFNELTPALDFIFCFHRNIILGIPTSNNIKVCTGFDYGEFFMHKDDIYGVGLNLSTKMSYLARENEILISHIDEDVLKALTINNSDLIINQRSGEEIYYSVAFIDDDLTNIRFQSTSLTITHNNKIIKTGDKRNEEILIGRSEHADICIDDNKISRSHATITINNQSISIKDHSANGTTIYYSSGDIISILNGSHSLSHKGEIWFGEEKQSSNSKNYIEFNISEDPIIFN